MSKKSSVSDLGGTHPFFLAKCDVSPSVEHGRSEASHAARDCLSALRWSVEARDAAAITYIPLYHKQCGYGH